MFISQVSGYPNVLDKDRYDIEFKVNGSVYAVLNADPEKIPSTGNTLSLSDHEGMPTYLIRETGQQYKPIFFSGLTDLILLEAL